MTLSEVEKITGKNYLTIFRWIKEKGFPMYTGYGANMRWTKDEVNQWLKKGEYNAS